MGILQEIPFAALHWWQWVIPLWLACCIPAARITMHYMQINACDNDDEHWQELHRLLPAAARIMPAVLAVAVPIAATLLAAVLPLLALVTLLQKFGKAFA